MSATKSQVQDFIGLDSEIKKTAKPVKKPFDRFERPHLSRHRMIAGVHIQNNPKTGEEEVFRAIPGKQMPVIETYIDLSAKYPEKYQPADSISSIPAELLIQPGETLTAFAERIGKLAAEQKTLTSEGAQPIVAGPQTPTGKPLPPPDLDATLNSMSVDELKAHAAAEEIDLGTAKSKADIVTKIKNSTK